MAVIKVCQDQCVIIITYVIYVGVYVLKPNHSTCNYICFGVYAMLNYYVVPEFFLGESVQ